MTDCPFQLNADGLWQCPQCEKPHPIKLDKPPRRNCPIAMTQCLWQYIETTARGPRFRCPQCKQEVVVEVGTPREVLAKMPPCSGRPESSPPAFRRKRRIRRYRRAVKKWRAAGRPVRSPEEIKVIYAEHCQPCQHFNSGYCEVCGCRVRRSGFALTNKIKMATEACELGKWPEASILRQ